MKSFFKLICLLPAVFFIAACTDLEEEIRGEITENQDVVPPAQSPNTNRPVPNDGLGAAFSRLLNGSANHGSYFSVTEISTDEVVITQKGGDWFDGGIWLNMHRHDFRSTNDGLNGAWNDSYAGITQANALLFVDPDDPNDFEPDAEQIAQLRMVRAYFYWRLLDLFGNVKLTTTPGIDVPQSSRDEVFAFVEQELLDAIPDLPSTRAAYGRTNQAAAYALLARLYLNAEVYTGNPMYNEAIAAADEVINSGLYGLSADYASVFAPDNVDNIEHIMVIPYDESTGTGMNLAQMTLHYPSQLTFNLQEQPWNGYSTLEEFYNSYAAEDVRREANFIVGPQFDQDGNPVLDLAFDPADDDGAPVNYTPEINELAPNGSRQAGARLGKFSFKQGQTQHMDNDFPILRYGEVLLNRAEAEARLSGSWSAGLMYINELRTRAGVPEYASLTEEEFLAERGRELFSESLRRTDLIRFGRWGDEWWEKPAHSDPNKNIMPIPLTQIQASAQSDFELVQNPGY